MQVQEVPAGEILQEVNLSEKGGFTNVTLAMRIHIAQNPGEEIIVVIIKKEKKQNADPA